jgi:N-acetylmuramidase-like protein/putative peptidoglycan binding protein
MSEAFRGSALPVDSDGIQEAVDVLGVRAAELWSIIHVETSGCGFMADRRPKILFERHVFSAKTDHVHDAQHPDLSNRTPGGYGPAGAHQYERLERAIALDRHAALLSTSWGIGQVMGFNATAIGYGKAEDMIDDMSNSESAQLAAMARFIDAKALDGALRAHDWARFAAGYNGSNYRINNYDTRLAAAYQYFDRGALPDLSVRSAQVYLTYLGYDPQDVDGVMGRLTRSAMNDFQRDRGLPITDFVDEQTLEALKQAAAAK